MKISFSTNKKSDVTIANNVKLPYAASKRVFPQVRWLLILILVASPFVLLLGKLAWDWILVTSPGTIWLEKRTINAIEAGTVEQVLYHRGDTVGSDMVIFRVKRKISDNRMEQLALLEAERDAAALGLDRGDPVPAVPIRDRSAEIAAMQQSVAYYEQIRDATKRLMDQGAATRAEMAEAENKLREVKTALAALTVAAAAPPEVNRTAPAVNPTRIAQVEQSIKALKKLTEEFFDIRSGPGGKISSILVSDGQSFAAGEPLAVLLNTEQVHIVTYVDPNKFKKVNVGAVVTVKILGTGRKMKAIVEQPPVTADNVPSGISGKIYPITMRGVQVFLKVTDLLPEEEIIDGLPVEIEW